MISELAANQVLAPLPERTWSALTPLLSRRTFAAWDVLLPEEEEITTVYFPVDGVISIVSVSEEGEVAESYTAGRDGLAGVETVNGAQRLIFRTMCQVPGVFYAMPARAFLRLYAEDETFAARMRAYLTCLQAFTGRAAACNLMHPIVERCARWLLTTQDRVDNERFSLTHDILSTMLGVRRASVSVAAGALQKAGLIEYSRGTITILDRARLEEASCECYRVVADEFRRVLGGP
jgi:CRP-like cAMP-binding protein